MSARSPRIEQQHEGQEHEFLAYGETYIHFIYSFAWDTCKAEFTKLVDEPTRKGWAYRRLHERSLDGRRREAGRREVGPTYQPNLVTSSRVLERTAFIAKQSFVLAPVEEYTGRTLGRCIRIPVGLEHTVRLFDNGGGVCTFTVRLSEADATFQNIHAILRLATNVDRGDLTDAEMQQEAHGHLTASFLAMPLPSEDAVDHSLVPETGSESPTLSSGYVTLHDLFRKFLTVQHHWAPPRARELWLDCSALDVDRIDQDFQTPFVFAVSQVERNSFQRFCKHPTIDHAREIASIACKLTLDNRYVEHDYLHLSEDYLREVLPFSARRNGLINLCLDRRLFFTTTRRGAVALTASLDDVPSFFVIPSFLNLLEILRVRWHLSSIVSIRLDRAISELRLDSSEDPIRLLRDIYLMRSMFGAFLRDPLPTLFDGGSITDVAEIAERQHWLPRLLIDTERKLTCLENLVRDKLNIQRWEAMDISPVGREANRGGDA